MICLIKKTQEERKMKGLRFHEVGNLSNLKVEEIEIPKLRNDEALVQVKAFAINPSDVKNVLGNMKGLTTLPRTPGRDFSGIVVKGGLKLGQAVFGSAQIGFDRDGAQAEYVAVPEEALIVKPETLSFEVCATFGIPYITAWAAIIDHGHIDKGDDILITGVNGAVGSIAAQISKWKGAHVIGAVRSAAGAKNTLAVDEFIDLEKEELSQAVLEKTSGKGVKLTFDTVGGPLFQECLKSLAVKGRHIVIATLEAEVPINLLNFYRREQTMIGINTLKFSNHESADILQKIIPLITQGHIQAPEPTVFTFDQVLDVYQQIQLGKFKGKAVVRF